MWVNDVLEHRAREVAESLPGPGRARVIKADVTSPAKVRRMREETGPIDVLVNNAGVPTSGFELKRFIDTAPEDWEYVIWLNLGAVLHVTHAYVGDMAAAGWGRVLTIVSDAGRKGERFQTIYGAAKAGAMGFSRGLAAEVASEGVTVNCISLGTMRSGATARGDRAAVRPRGAPLPALSRRPHRPARGRRPARRAAVQRRRDLDHRAGLPGERRLLVRAVMVELPTGYMLRPAASEDATAIAEVVQAQDVADFGEPDFTEADLLDDWMRPRFSLDTDSWVMLGPTGRIVGYAYVWESQPDRELEADAFVLPEYTQRGLGGQLLDLIEHQPRALASGRTMTLGVFASRAKSPSGTCWSGGASPMSGASSACAST